MFLLLIWKVQTLILCKTFTLVFGYELGFYIIQLEKAHRISEARAYTRAKFHQILQQRIPSSVLQIYLPYQVFLEFKFKFHIKRGYKC